MKTLFWKAFVLFVILNLALGQTFPALAREDALETPTVTSTPTQTPTPEGEVTEFPTTSTPQETATASPSETVTPTATPEVSITPTIPVIEINVYATPETIKPDGKITLDWEVLGLSEPNPSLTLQLSLPKEFEPTKENAEKFDSQNGIISIPLSELSGTVQVETTAEITEDAVFIISLYDEKQVLLSMNQVIVPLREKFDVDKNGGEITARDGELKVKFNSDALKNEDIEVEIGNPAGNGLPYSLSGKPFEIKAKTKKDGSELTQFDERVEFTIDLNAYGFENVKNGELFLYWYNPEIQEWHGLSSWIDEETNTLHGSTNHFSIFDIGVNNWEASKIPNMNAFQVSNFTGAANYSYPIKVPAGPGGLQPNLSINYNSQVVDQSTTESQTGWIGIGWSLDTGSILLNSHNTSDTNDDSWSLSINGMNTEIYKNGTTYYTTDAYFIKITRTGNVWTVWDKEGNIYTFDYFIQMAYQNAGSTGATFTPYKWSLTKVKNIFGKELTYSYTKETKDVTFYYNQSQQTHVTDTASYLDMIKYPDDRIRVKFILESRTDYDYFQLIDELHHSFERQRLDKIVIQKDTDGNGDFEAVSKTHDLRFHTPYDGVHPIWPNALGTQVSTLISIQEFGSNSTSSDLPATTFTYGDYLHLTEAQNGYGGTIKFEYEPWYYTANARPSYKASFTSAMGVAFSINCANTLCFIPPGENLTKYEFLVSALRPGGAYYMYASTSVASKVNAYDNSTANGYAASDTIAPYQPTHTFILPATVNQLASMVENLSPGSGLLYEVRFWGLTTIYRVTKKTLLDGQGHSYESTYSYTDAAVNDATHSASMAANTSYTEHYAEFRGHASVTETTPNGTTITTTYFQDDIYKGRIANQVVKYGGVKISETINTYTNSVLNSYTYNGKTMQSIWVKLASTEYRTYDLSGTNYTATKSLYSYETSYGNLTTTTEQSLDGSTWLTYRSSTNSYWFNNSGTRYLVSLPGKTSVFDSSGNTLSTTIYLYDGNTGNYAVMPTDGKLTGVRSLLKNGTDYNQVSFIYDSFGNRTSQTTWTGYGTDILQPQTGAQSTATVYDNVFYVYPVKVTNALGQFTLMDYDFSKGVPTCVTPLLAAGSGNTSCNSTLNRTTADYDQHGRIENVYRPDPVTGQPEATANLHFDYADANPFTTTATLVPTNYSVIRKYDGLGRVIQVVRGDSVVDTIYDSVTVTKQRVPYTAGTTPPNQFSITTYYPNLRKTEVQAPDGTITSTESDGLITKVTDAKGYMTTTTADVWGRTDFVQPPTGTGPNIDYSYDALNNLLSVIQDVGTPVGTNPGANGLIAWWSLNEASGTRNDSHGTNHLTDNNTVTVTAGKQGNAASFVRANNEYLSVADNPQLSGGDTSFTLVAHAYLNSNTSPTILVDKSATGATAPPDYRLSYNGTGFRFRIAPDGASQTPYVDSGPVSVGAWHTVIGWYDSVNNTINIQVDNGTVVSASNSIGSTNTTYPLTIGAYLNGALGIGLDGNLDEVALYKRVLSTSERSWLYNNGAGRTYTELTTNPASSSTITLTYDNAGRKKTMSDPDMGSWTYTYDALGNLKTQTDARGCVLTLGYDNLNRLLNKTSSGSGCGTQVITSYTYDQGTNGIGHRTSMTSGTINNSWTYDNRGRLKTETAMGYTTTYNYNSADLLTSIVYPDTETVNYTYDSKMLLNSVIGTSNYVTSTTYDSVGRIDIRTLGNGLMQDFNYNAWTQQGGRLQSLTTGTLQNMTYQYDNAGNISNITNTIASETSTYGYDQLHRLTSWNLNSTTENYSYDSAGHLDVKAGVDLNYNDTSHKNAVTHIGSTQKYWYDANGNQITRIVGADTFNLAYDAENRLVEVKKNTVVMATFTYDGDGRRVKSIINGVTTSFVGIHYEISGSTITKYYYAGNARIAMRTGSTLTYLLTDHLGSTSITTSSTGSLISELRYKPWGEVRYSSGTTSTNYTYTGQYSNINDFGLLFYNARFYDPALGRFTSADTIVPSGVQGLDRYAYVNNSPVMYIDPTGHRCEPGDNEPGGYCYGTPRNNSGDNPLMGCQIHCSRDDIMDATLQERYDWFAWLREEMNIYQPGLGDWFGNIQTVVEGLVTTGQDNNYWMLSVDADILYAVQEGYATFRGEGTATTRGGQEWVIFFQMYEDRALPQALLTQWGSAEYWSTNDGLARVGLPNAVGDDLGFLAIGTIYRISQFSICPYIDCTKSFGGFFFPKTTINDMASAMLGLNGGLPYGDRSPVALALYPIYAGDYYGGGR